MNDKDNSIFEQGYKDLISLYVLNILIKKVDGYKTLSKKQKEYLEKVVFPNRAFLDANIEKSSNYKIENSLLINKNNQQAIEIFDYDNSTNYLLEPVGKIGNGYLSNADVSKFIFCSGKAPKDETFGTAEQVIKDLISERIKVFTSTPKNKKAGYKNNRYENTAKKAELSPLLKKLIKNIK